MKKMHTLTIGGETYAVYDQEAAHIDDTTVGDTAWSSRAVLDRLLPRFRYTGTAPACNPVADYPLTVISHVAPSETPCRQITLRHSGKNLWCFGDRIESVNVEPRLDFSAQLPAGTYTISAAIEANGGYVGSHLIAIYYANGNNLLRHMAADSTGRYINTFVAEDAIIAIRLYARSNLSSSAEKAVYSRIQLEAGGTSTDYQPYREPVEYTVELVPALYGGDFNWYTGQLTVTHDQDGNGLEVPEIQWAEAFMIRAFPGTNILQSDIGQTTVTGAADVSALLQKLLSNSDAANA